MTPPSGWKVPNPDLTYIPISVVELGGNDVPAELAAIGVMVEPWKPCER